MTRNLLNHAADPPIQKSSIASRSAAPGSAESRAAELPSPHGRSEIAQASRAFLAELEASLQASQQAVLSRDVALLEQCTTEQVRLRGCLEILWSPGAAQMPTNSSHRSDPASDVHDSDLELRAAQLRVLHLGRIQSALLDRAQRWLRTVTHLLAGLEQNYAFPTSRQLAPYPASTAGSGESMSRQAKPERPEEKTQAGNPCRA